MFYSLLFCKSGISLFHKAITIRGIFFTMSKTKKILTTTAAVAAATTGAMVATTAHADTTATSAQAKQSTVSAQDQLNNMQAQHSQAESQMASDNAAEMSSVTTETNNQVAKLQDQLKTNQASQAAEDAPKLASGTKAINQKADEATAKENATYSDAVKSQEAANKQALADAAKNIYTPAQKQQLEKDKTSQYNQDKAKLDQAHQTKLNNLKADHDKQATKLNDQIKANQTSAEQAHDQAVQSAKDKLASQISAAQSKVDQLTTKVNSDQTAVKNAQNNVNDAENKLNSAKNALNAVNTDKAIFPYYINDVLGTGYNGTGLRLLPVKDGYVSYKWDDGEIDKVAVEAYPHFIASLNSEGLVELMPAKGSDGFEWRDTDPNDYVKAEYDQNDQLTGKSLIEATKFAVNVLNDIRRQIGSPLLKINQASMKYATEIALDGPVVRNNNFDHNVEALNSTAPKYGANWWAENMHIMGTGYQDKTLASIKEVILDEIEGYYTETRNFSSNHWGHHKAEFGLGSYGRPNEYFGLQTSETGATTHFEFLELDNADPSQDIPLTDSKTTNLSKLRLAVSNAQADYDNVNSKFNDIKSELATDKNKLAGAQSQLSKLQNSRDDAIKTIPDVTESPKVKALKEQLADLESSYVANVKAENDAYNKQKSDLNAKYQKEIDAIKAYPENTDQLKQEQAQKLAQLKKEHEAKLAKIKADAEQQIAALKQKLADSHNDVNQSIIDKINALKAALAAKQDQLNQKLADLKANDAAEYNALRDKLMPKQAAAGVANGYLTAGGQVVSLATKSGHSASSETTALPRTGNNSSLAVVVLGAVSMMFGFGLMKKRG